MTKTLFVGQKVFLQGMNVFEIGSNKNHINKGLMASQISSLTSQLENLDSSVKQLAIPGYILKLIEENDDELSDLLKNLVDKNNISLLAVPYFNSSLSLLSSEELSSQLKLQEEITKDFFGKSSDGFFCSEGILPPVVESVLNKNYLTVYYPENSSLTLDNPDYKLVKTSVTMVGETVEGNLSLADSKMEGHLMSELRDLYPHIITHGDEDTLTSWRYMTQPSMILRAGVSRFSNDAYEHYTQMMNTMNDVAFKIKNVQLAKKGLFQEKPIISSSPSLSLAN